MKTGDIVKYTESESRVSNYDYNTSLKLTQALGLKMAKNAGLKKNEFTIIGDHATDTHILAEYEDNYGHKGVLFFERRCLELIKPFDSVINNYQIF